MVDPEMSTEDLAHLLTMSGLEVEEVEAFAAPFSHVIVAEVQQVRRHPQADHLSVCQVDAGTGKTVSVVCGAPNVHEGQKTALAVAGATLPAAKKDGERIVGKEVLHGVESEGILCSEGELGISEDWSALIELPEDAPPGTDLGKYLDLDDALLTFKLTPNRADCLSLLGVAREVSALTMTPLVMPPLKVTEPTMNEVLPLTLSAPDLCGRFTGRIIRNINAGAKTPMWMRQRLLHSGVRPLSVLVDISNYVMLEFGQPNHLYDLDRISGGLDVRWGRAGEKVALLNESTVDVDEWIGVIADDQGAESLAGIMGGSRSAISPDTRNIYIEAAFWWPQAIQGRSRHFNFSTDAGHRFERGVDFEGTVRATERITELVLAICAIPGETQVGPVDDQITNLPERLPVSMRLSRAQRLIGVAFTEDEVAGYLTRLDLPFVREPGVFVVTPPSWRFDMEIEEDVIEEVARLFGYDNIPALPPVAPNVMWSMPERLRSVHEIRRHMADLDYQEVVNYSFVEESWEADFADNADPIRLINPISSHMSVMRSTLIGSLLSNVRYNLNRRASRIRVFEVASVFHKNAGQIDSETTVAGFDQPRRLAAIAYGPVHDEQWGQSTRQADFFDIKADLEALFLPRSFRFEKAHHPACHPGRCAHILRDGEPVGVIGELHPRWQLKYELPLAPVFFELDLEALQPEAVPVYSEISRYPPVTRDIALVVSQSVAVAELMDVFEMTYRNDPQCAIMQSVVLFDDYRGKGLAGNEKSLAFRFTLQDNRSTLQDEAVEAAMKAFVLAAEKELGARLRT